MCTHKFGILPGDKNCMRPSNFNFNLFLSFTSALKVKYMVKCKKNINDKM